MNPELLNRQGILLEAGEAAEIEMYPGFWRQTLLSGEKVMMCRFRWRAGAVLPEHQHVHEQIGYVVSGAVELTIAGQTFITREGCCYFVASHQPHSARALEDSLVIDAFSPPREDYLQDTE